MKICQRQKYLVYQNHRIFFPWNRLFNNINEKQNSIFCLILKRISELDRRNKDLRFVEKGLQSKDACCIRLYNHFSIRSSWSLMTRATCVILVSIGSIKLFAYTFRSKANDNILLGSCLCSKELKIAAKHFALQFCFAYIMNELFITKQPNKDMSVP